MKFESIALLLVLACCGGEINAFVVSPATAAVTTKNTGSYSHYYYTSMLGNTALRGYLDDLNKDLYSVADNPDIEGSTKEATDMDKAKVDRLGPGDWSTYVEFDEFDGGDGQMGVAGDGKKVSNWNVT